MNFDEQKMQMEFIEYLNRIGIKFYNHSPNEGKRSAKEGNKNKKMGTQRGFPDLEIPYPANGKSGLYIEFKTKKGTVQPEQNNWLSYLNSKGYVAVIVRSFEDGCEVLKSYLKGQIK